MLPEPNNSIAEATPSGVNSSTETSVTVSDRVDNLADVDLYQFQLERGQGITLDVTTVSSDGREANFDSFLRIFDRDGIELAHNDDTTIETSEFSLDSYAGFIANSTGDYYVGISSTGNQSYDPIDTSDLELNAGNFSGGDYELTFSLVDVVADTDADNTLTEAIATDVSLQNPIAIDSTIDVESDVDLYRLELPEATGINLSLRATGDDASLDAYLRLFDATGRELAANDDRPAGDNPSVDSALSFAPEAAGAYFVGVSSSGNGNYDPLNGDTNLNFEPNRGFSRGDYQLELAIEPIIADEDPDNTLTEAIVTEIAESSLLLDGEIDAVLDVDVFELTVGADAGIKLNLQTDANSELDPYLRLFDDEGNEVSFDASSLSLVPPSPGTYYAAVSAVGNENYDPIAGRTNFTADLLPPNSTTGSYQLEIEVATLESDRDPDNTLTEAIASGIDRDTPEITLTGNINTGEDVDIYQVQLDLGEGLTADVETTNLNSELDSYLRLFDAAGNELAFNNDRGDFQDDADTDSSLSFIPEVAGTYYVGVSSDGNSDYDAIAGSNNFTPPAMGFSQGDFELNLEVLAVSGDEDGDNTLAEAIAFNPDFNGSMPTISNSIESSGDVDLYVVELDLGSTVSFDVDTDGETELDTYLRIFDAEGNELRNNDDGVAPEEQFGLDSYQEFTATATGTYYVGVSSYGNFDYDVLEGSNNFTEDEGATTGDYELTVDVIELVNGIEGTSADERLSGTVEIDAISGLAGNDTITGGAANDNLIGGTGNDSLFGNRGDDVLQGSAGNDTLFGGAGDDILDGAGGRDRLWGNEGADVFVIAPDSQLTSIVDFEVGIDRIALIEGIGFEDLSFNDFESGTRIMMAERIIGTLVNVESSQILAADFIV